MIRIELDATLYTDGDPNLVHRRWEAFLDSLQYTNAKVAISDYRVYDKGQSEPKHWRGSGVGVTQEDIDRMGADNG